MVIKCMVACVNAKGQRDFEILKIKCTLIQYMNREHYQAAEQYAHEKHCNPPIIVLDENDPGGRRIVRAFNWKGVDVLNIIQE